MSTKGKKSKINIDSIRKSGWGYILASVIFIILGLMLIIEPTGTGKKLAFLFGGALIAYGAFKLISYFTKDKGEKSIDTNMIIGTVLVIVGLAIIILHNGVAQALSFILGAFLIADGMLKLQTAINAKRSQISTWWIVLVAALVCIGFGCALLFIPGLRANAPYIALGIAFLIDGVQNLISAIYSHIIVKKAPKDTININDHAPVETKMLND